MVMASSGSEPPLHVAIVPWLAFGHMIPFFHLAVALASAGLRISFISTPKNTARLPKKPAHVSSLITFIDFPLPPTENLPENAEATVDVSFEESQYLKVAYDSLKKPVKDFLEKQISPDWILFDGLGYWAGEIAQELSVPCVCFSVLSAAAVSFLGRESLMEEGRRRWWPTPESMTKKPAWVPFESAVAFRTMEAKLFHHAAFLMDASGMSVMERVRRSLQICSAMAIRSCNEYEVEYLNLLEDIFMKTVIPVGLLPPPAPPLLEEPKFRDWLDAQKPKSVVFVSFGSEYKLSESDLCELSFGLEQSNVVFLWSLRRPEDEKALPVGFMDRMRDRGMVSFGWAPQLEILAHPSVGGSLFHSGWGSIIETLRYGHALVLLPAIIDQGLNARLLVQKGLAIEVEKNEDGSFNRDEIAKSLVKAMSSDEGEEIRRNAREMGAVFADQELHDQYVKRFVEYLLKHRKNL